MANGQQSSAHQDPLVQRIDQDVRRLGTEIDHVRGQMVTKQDFTNFASRIEASIAALSAGQADSRAPNWTALGVLLSGIVAFGAFAYWPIKEQINDARADIKTISENAVFNRRYSEQVSRILEQIKTLREGAIDRHEQAAELKRLDVIDADITRRVDGAVRRLERLEQREITGR